MQLVGASKEFQWRDEEAQVGVVELEASQLTVIDPDLSENGLLDAAVYKKSGFGLKLLENQRYCVRLESLETISQRLYLLKACSPRAASEAVYLLNKLKESWSLAPLFHEQQNSSFE